MGGHNLWALKAHSFLIWIIEQSVDPLAFKKLLLFLFCPLLVELDVGVSRKIGFYLIIFSGLNSYISSIICILINCSNVFF